jgi:hypothetical protein
LLSLSIRRLCGNFRELKCNRGYWLAQEKHLAFNIEQFHRIKSRLCQSNLGYASGADNGDEPPPKKNVDFTISSPSSLEFSISFKWNYGTSNYYSFWDPFGYLTNDTFYQLTDNFGPTEQSGSASLTLAAGDTFGFR